MWLLSLSAPDFLEIAKWVVLVALGLGVTGGAFFGAYKFARTRDRRLAAVARQTGADLIEDVDAPDPPRLTEQLRGIASQLAAVPGQINTAILEAEARLGGQMQSLRDMDQHLLRALADDRRLSDAHRQAVIRRLEALERRGVRQEHAAEGIAHDLLTRNKE